MPLGSSLGGTLAGPHVKCGLVIPSHYGGHTSPEKPENLLPVIKNHTVLDDGINMEDETKIPIENRKHIFWQTFINDQRPKLRMHINEIVIEGLLNMGAGMAIFTPESWHMN